MMRLPVNVSLTQFFSSALLQSSKKNVKSFRPIFLSCIQNPVNQCHNQGHVIFLHPRKFQGSLQHGLFKNLKTAAHSNSSGSLSNGPFFVITRQFSTSFKNCASKGGKDVNTSNTTGLIYVMAIFVLMVGGAYAAVPLYKVFCQVSGLGGQAQKGHDAAKVEFMKKVERQIKVRFNADVASSMRWNFRPQQTEVIVAPGETALAFYTARNPTDKAIIGISTYNVLPYDAGQYFNKIQCFCFEEQRLNPNEQVDMPVFFYIDPEFADDPKLENVHTITLSYTFFEAKEGLSLPLPGYPQPHDPPVPV